MSMTRPIWAVRCEPKRGCAALRDARGKLIRWRAAHDMYVRAATSEGAVKTARRNNFDRKYSVTGPARIATPQDLGCVQVAA